MSPTAFAAALRDFAAAARQSPDPAASVADLALLIAQAVEPEPVAQPEPDPLAFPPLDPIVATVAGTEYSAADLLRLARERYEPGPEAFDALPAEEQSLHAQLALSQLRQEQPADPAAA